MKKLKDPMVCQNRWMAQAIALFSLLVGGSAAATAQVEECELVTATVNQTNQQVQEISQNNTSQELESLLFIADVANQAASELQLLTLEDQQLQSLRDRFINLYTNTALAARNFVDAVYQEDTEAIQQTYEAVLNVSSQEEPLVDEINEYCDR